jgi:hypothetical protein
LFLKFKTLAGRGLQNLDAFALLIRSHLMYLFYCYSKKADIGSKRLISLFPNQWIKWVRNIKKAETSAAMQNLRVAECRIEKTLISVALTEF